MMRTLHILIFLFISLGSQVFGQVQTQRHWFLGNGTRGLRFDQPANTATLITKPAVAYGTGGSATVTDAATGTLLFYTDGLNVYDINHTLMPNGGGLSGNTSGNSPAVVVPVPGQPDQYYIITNNANFNTVTGTAQFSIVDMAQFGNAVFPSPATGVVTQKNQAIPMLTGLSEGMIVIPHSNGTDYWIISQASGTNNYFVTQVSAGGVFNTTLYTGVGFSISAASFAYNATTGKLAVAPQNSNTDIPILNFDDTTGTLTFDVVVQNSGKVTSTNQSVYDIEWSPSGQYLYMSVYGQAGIPANVLQWDSTNPTHTLASVLPQPPAIFESYGLQLGPDSAIYHLYRATAGGSILMGKITDADSVAAKTMYVAQAFPGNIDFRAKQFPSFSPSADPNITVSFSTLGTCSNNPTSFFPTVTPAADSLVWDFGDGSDTTAWAPIHTYENGGAYSAMVTAYLNGQTATATVPINITQFDLEIQLVQDTTACSCELPFPRATNPPPPCTLFTVAASINGGSPTSTQWFGPSGLIAGQTTTTLAPDSAGYYFIKVGDASGCFGYAGVNIKEYGVQDQRANIWYFGQNAGIDFNPLPDGPAVAISNPVMNAPEGSATISDRNGQVIIFTDGVTVWDRTFTVLAANIGGDPNSTQSAIIVPVPGDETLYYIFTTEAVDGGGFNLRYSLYDLKVGTTGAVVQTAVMLFAKSTERITSNGNWLVAHEWGNNNFRAYQITSNGIGSPVVSSAGSDHAFSPIENAEGYMKFGPQGRLAVVIPSPGTSNVIELFDFVDSTGVVTNSRRIDLNQAAGEVYGLTFSPSGNKLFATVHNGGNSIIYEYAIDSLGVTTLLQAQNVPGDLGAMQIGPDGQIYVAVNGSTSLLSFQANENLTQITPLGALQPFPLAAGTQSTLGLPNFVQIISDPLQGPSISASGFCLGSPTDFTGTGTDPVIDMYQWFFGDGSGDTQQQTQHTYAAAGTYNVSLRITNRCGLDTTLFQSVTITPPPAAPTFLQPGQVPVLCTGSLVLEATPATNPNLANLSFIWSTTETTRTITVNDQAIYGVVIVDNLGCSSSGSLIVADNRPILELGPDLTVCQNAQIAPLNAQNPGTTYAWQINGVPNGSSQTHAVDTSVPGTFEYKVLVTDPITTCFVRDSVSFTINQSPVISVTPFPTSGCGANDGRVELTITNPSTSLFTYSIVGNSSSVSDIDKPIGTYSTLADLIPGTYGVSVVDQVSGCFFVTTRSVNDPAPFTITSVVRQNNCDPLILQVSHNAPTPYDYQVVDVNSNNVVVDFRNGVTSVGSFLTAGLPSGDYIVQITAAGGCVQSSLPQNFMQDAQVAVTGFTADGCTNPITLSVTTAAATPTFIWTGPNITSGAGTANITATPPQGLQNYSVNVSAPGFCPIDFPIPVNVDNNTIPAISQSDACADQVTVTVTPNNGAYLYRWFRNGSATPDPGLGGSQSVFTSADNGDQFVVRLVNTISGCPFDTPQLNVNIIGDVQVTLNATPACEGSPFTITATTSQPVTTYQWFYEGAIINGEASATLIDTKAGTYKSLVTLSTCTDEEEIKVLLAPLTSGKLVDRALICDDPANTDMNTNQVILDPGPDFTSYDWFKDGVSLGIMDPTYTATEEGLYSVDLINLFGCPSNDKTQVDIECLPKITGPNAFRPSGINDNFFLYTFFIADTDFQVYIFNRWGEMIFASSERQFKWNGGYNNTLSKPAPPGTYTYLVKYKSSYRPQDGVKEKRGGVLLLR